MGTLQDVHKLGKQFFSRRIQQEGGLAIQRTTGDRANRVSDEASR
jgi:hypothetical protein